jgi:hypothetical protein
MSKLSIPAHLAEGSPDAGENDEIHRRNQKQEQRRNGGTNSRADFLPRGEP